MSKVDTLKTNVDQIQHDLRSAKSHKQDLEKQLKRLDTKIHYSPDAEELKTERESIVDSITEVSEKVDELHTQYGEAEKALRQAQVEMERERLESESTDYYFSVPDEDPIIACQMLSGAADRLQYQFCSSQGYYETLCGRIYGNQAGTDQAISWGTADDPNPEISQDDISELNRLQEQRDYIQKLRFACEREFRKHEAEIPSDSTFRPQLLRRSDQEVLRQIEQRREERFAAQQQQRREAQKAAGEFSRAVDMAVYQPGRAA